MEKVKIIGTGLSGLVGSRITELLKNKYNFVDFSLDSGVDILNDKALKEAFNKNKEAEAVLHLAAFTDTSAAWQERGDKKGLCYRLNVLGTKNIVSLCQKHNKYLIYISTDFVFDGKKDNVYTEKDKPCPIEWYGQTKYWGEQEVLKSGLPAVVARIAFPFRAHFEQKKDVVRKMIEGLKNKTLYPMFADQVVTPTFIDDIAWGLDYFIKNKSVGVYHLVGSTSLSSYQMARMVAQTFGFNEDLVKKGSLLDYQKSQPQGSRPWQKRLALSNKKISALGIKMLSFEEALLKLRQQLLS